MPIYSFSAEEAGRILSRSPITIRLEARRQKIGFKKDGRYLFSNRDILALEEIFAAKRKPADQEADPFRKSFEWTLFMKVDRVEHLIEELQTQINRLKVGGT
jgi:hypothetical protein